MRLFGRRQATATVEPVASSASSQELAAAIAHLQDAVRADGGLDDERELIRLRNQMGIRRVEEAAGSIRFADPDVAALPDSDQLPEFSREQVTPGLMRAAILRDGCVLVRGLVDRQTASSFADAIERAYSERERRDAGQPHDEHLYDEFTPDERYGEPVVRGWIKEGGGLLAIDSPRLNFQMMEMFDAAGLPSLVAGYLGEAPVITAQKTTLRKAEPSVPGGWHQDGKFMGPVRALNLWLSLSRCGDVAPGLEIVPRRLDGLVTTATEEAALDYVASQRVAEEAAGDKPIQRPIFEPGDALFFDELFLHKTGSDPSMLNPRYAIENWFFGGSGFPREYAPIAV